MFFSSVFLSVCPMYIISKYQMHKNVSILDMQDCVYMYEYDACVTCVDVCVFVRLLVRANVPT